MPCCSQAQFPGCCDYWPPAAAMSRDLKGEFATMRNKSVIVTGATAGIGRAAALQLASLRADVVVTGRDPERGRATEEALRAAGSPRARFVRADHSTLDGNLALAAEVKHLVDRVDVLVNNVGGLMPRRQITADDAEMTLALNVRAPVVLTDQLRPVLCRDGLVVNVASDAFSWFRGDPFEGPDEAGDYEPFRAYARAKLLLVLATLAQGRELRPEGMRVVAVNPGPAWTPGTRALNPNCMPAPKVMWPIVRLVQRSRSADQAARVLTRVVAAPDDVLRPGVTGCYVSARGKVRDLGALGDDLERQERAVRTGWALGNASAPERRGSDA